MSTAEPAAERCGACGRASKPDGAAQESQLPRAPLLGALIGVPVAAIAYFFLVGVGKAQTYVFATLPKEFGFSSQPQCGRSFRSSSVGCSSH